MDIILTNHEPNYLENLFQNHFMYDHKDYVLMAEETNIPWLQFIPKYSLQNLDYTQRLYAEIHRLAFYLQKKEYGHFNIAKIGNKLPFYHIHLVFRSQDDETWPDAIWCKEDLKLNPLIIPQLKSDLTDFFI